MSKMNAPLLAFNRGEVSKIALARVDLSKMQLSAECQLNWEPRVLGPMMLRPGLEFVGEILGDAPSKQIPFIFAKTDTALMEITAGVLRPRVAEQLVTRPAVATLISDPTFVGGGSWDTSDTTSGASVTIGGGSCSLIAAPVGSLARVKQNISVATADFGKEHGIRLVVTNGPVTVRAGSDDGLSDLIQQTDLDTGTHALACTPSTDIFLQIESTDAWAKMITSVAIDLAGTLQIPAPWGTNDLKAIRTAQSGDVIYVATYGLQQYKIERRSLNGWSVTLYRSSNGPFQTGPGIEANFTPSAYFGNGTLSSDRPYFQVGHVGSIFQLFSSGQFYQTKLGANNAFTPAVRVSGAGSVARNYTWTASDTWVGQLTLQRSFDGPTSGFTDVANITSNGTLSSSTGGTGGTPDLDNAIAWERVGFKGGDYTSGNATLISNYAGGGGFSIVRVTGYTSPTSVNIEILQPLSSLTATTDWLETDWSQIVGFPTSLAFIEGRLGFAGRDKTWLGQSNNYTGFATQDLQGNDLGDAGAIIETFGEGPVDTVSWILQLSRPLYGREMSITSARSSSFDQPLTPTDFSVKDCSTQGAERLPALKIDKRGIFVQQSGRRVYELLFDAQQMDYSAHDLTRLNLDIGLPGFAATAVARQPDTVAYLPRNDGVSAAVLYDPDDEVVAWYRITTLGIIEDVCVLPSATGVEDIVYFTVRRTINGVTRRFLEKLATRDNCVGGLINQQLDSHIVYQGAPATSISLPHLPNTKVTVWADGAPIGEGTTNGAGLLSPLPDNQAHSNIVAGVGGEMVSQKSNTLFSVMDNLAAYEGLPAEVFADQQPADRMVRVGTVTVTNGMLKLPPNWQASSAIAFFGYCAPFMSAKLAYGAQKGSPLTQKKQIDHLGLVLYDTHNKGITYGQRFDTLSDLPAIVAGAPIMPGTVWSQFDEPMFELEGNWDTDARLCLLAKAPLPAMVGAVVIGQATNEK